MNELEVGAAIAVIGGALALVWFIPQAWAEVHKRGADSGGKRPGARTLPPGALGAPPQEPSQGRGADQGPKRGTETSPSPGAETAPGHTIPDDGELP